jgi:hypothetical protein
MSSNEMKAPPPALPGAEETMYFSRETNTWRFETDDGTEMEYDETKNAWVPVVRECTYAKIYIAQIIQARRGYCEESTSCLLG